MANRAAAIHVRRRILAGNFPNGGFDHDGVLRFNQTVRNQFAQLWQQRIRQTRALDELDAHRQVLASGPAPFHRMCPVVRPETCRRSNQRRASHAARPQEFEKFGVKKSCPAVVSSLRCMVIFFAKPDASISSLVFASRSAAACKKF
jgi:hypothetical protein